jgi:hypothetical protein
VRWVITFFFLTAIALLMPIRLVAARNLFTPEAAETVLIALLGAALFYASIFLQKRRAILTPPVRAGIIEPVPTQRNPAQAARANHAPTWKKRQACRAASPESANRSAGKEAGGRNLPCWNCVAIGIEIHLEGDF